MKLRVRQLTRLARIRARAFFLVLHSIRDRVPIVTVHLPAIAVHPWELDPEQPRMAVGTTTRLRHYRGLERTADRLARLVRDFKFDSVTSMLDLAALKVA